MKIWKNVSDLQVFNQDNFVHKYFTCKSPLIIDPIDTVRVEGPEMLKKNSNSLHTVKNLHFCPKFQFKENYNFFSKMNIVKTFC